MLIGSLMTGCASDGSTSLAVPVSVSLSDDAAGVLADVERRLLNTPSLSIEATLEADGAVSSSLVGRWLIERGNVVEIQASGTFAGRPVSLSLTSDGDMMSVVEGRRSLRTETPGRLNEGLVIGMTRMGLLHNLAMLSGGQPPDGTDGRVRDWARTERHSWAGTRELPGGDVALALTFDVVVDGQPAGEATLWIDERTGLPVERRQTVHFDEADMQVIEFYEVLELAPGH